MTVTVTWCVNCQLLNHNWTLSSPDVNVLKWPDYDAEGYLEPYGRSMIEFFSKLITYVRSIYVRCLRGIAVNFSFLDVYGSPKYASEYLLRNRVWPYCNLSYLIPLTNRIILLRPFSLRIGFKRTMYDAYSITSSSFVNNFFWVRLIRDIIKRICWWHLSYYEQVVEKKNLFAKVRFTAFFLF